MIIKLLTKIKRKIILLRNIVLPQKNIFTAIFKNREWHDTESFSGPGSNLENTAVIRQEFQKLLHDLKVKKLLDLPCGDFNWMKELSFIGIDYTGSDIVADLIKLNKEKYARPGIQFSENDLINGKLPDADLILCRDCLVHFSYRNIIKAINNIRKSNITYLLTTSFPEHENRDIVTGDWRPIDLTKAPFNFPKPILIINEDCREENGNYLDKSLCLWKVEDLPQLQ